MPEVRDFDDVSLEIRGLGAGRFETRFQAKGQGEMVGPFGMQLDAETIRPLLNVFHREPYGFGPDARKIGSTLFNALFQGDVLRLFERSLSGSNDARPDGTSRGVRLRLLFDLKDKEIRPLAALPWELLHDPMDRIYYAQGRRRLLVRHPEAPRPVEGSRDSRSPSRASAATCGTWGRSAAAAFTSCRGRAWDGRASPGSSTTSNGPRRSETT